MRTYHRLDLTALIRRLGAESLREGCRNARRKALRTWRGSTVVHSQIVTTVKPAEISAFLTLRSRSTFRLNFARQNSTFERGVLAFGQFGCRCQKHPCTNTAMRRDRLARSGRPGRSPLRSVYRNPISRATRRTASSGAVPDRRTRPMRSETSAVVTTSASRTSRRSGFLKGCGVVFRRGIIP